VFQSENEGSTGFHDSEIKEYLGDGTVWKPIPALKWPYYSSRLFSLQCEYFVEIVKGEISNKIRLWGGFHF